MNLGVSMWCHVRTFKAGRMDVPAFIQEAARIGADGVELLDFFYKDVEAERPAVLAALEATGLPCPIFSVANNFATADPAERRAALDRILFGVREAKAHGAGVVRVFAGDVSDGIGFDQAREWIVAGLAEASKHAAEAGVRLALENHGKLAGRGDQVAGIVAEARERSGTDALGANPDTGNFLLVDQDPAEAVAEVAGLANMVHFKDFAESADGIYHALSGKRYAGTVIGEGDVPLDACVRNLRSGGFDGWFSLEYEGEGDPFEETERSLANARRVLSAAYA
jgi:sugar phosphate isomerase/epimerase